MHKWQRPRVVVLQTPIETRNSTLHADSLRFLCLLRSCDNQCDLGPYGCDLATIDKSFWQELVRNSDSRLCSVEFRRCKSHSVPDRSIDSNLKYS